MIRAVGYPILVDTGNINGGEYSIIVNGELIFTGKSIERIIDIAPLLRDYINADLIIMDNVKSIGLENSEIQLDAGIMNVTGINDSGNKMRVVVEGGNLIGGDDYALDEGGGFTSNDGGDFVILSRAIDVDKPLLVANNYNEDNISLLPSTQHFTSVFIRNKVDTRQVCFVGANAGVDLIRLVVTGYLNISPPVIFDLSHLSNSIILRGTIGPLSDPFTKLRLSVYDDSGVQYDEMLLDVEMCDKNRYAIYAVNRSGGISHIICEGRHKETSSMSARDIETAYNPLSHTSREIVRQSVSVMRKWQLSTGYMSDNDSLQLEEILTSPRIVLHDMIDNRMFAVNSSDASFERKIRLTNSRRPVEYTINFTEARKGLRR